MDFPPRSTFVQTFGETLKSLSLKTKAPGAAVTGRGNGELITHPEHSPGCSHSAQASSSIPVLIPSCRLHPHLCQEQTHGTEKQPKPQIQQGLTPDPSLGWKQEHVGWGGGRHSMRIPFASPLSKQTKSSPWRSAVCAMTFSRGPCRLRRTKLWQSHRGLWAAGNAVFHRCAGVQESVQGFGGFWHYFAEILSSIADWKPSRAQPDAPSQPHTLPPATGSACLRHSELLSATLRLPGWLKSHFVKGKATYRDLCTPRE